LAIIAQFSPLIEIGAGTGYWCYLLRQRGVTIWPYDNRPPVLNIDGTPTSSSNDDYFKSIVADINATSATSTTTTTTLISSNITAHEIDDVLPSNGGSRKRKAVELPSTTPSSNGVHTSVSGHDGESKRLRVTTTELVAPNATTAVTATETTSNSKNENTTSTSTCLLTNNIYHDDSPSFVDVARGTLYYS
jgi:hypothetical protein